MAEKRSIIGRSSSDFDNHHPMLPVNASSLQGWTPTRFFPDQDGQPAVQWCQLGDLRLTAPFFMQTVLTAQSRGGSFRQTSADALAGFADQAPDLPLSGLIFHLSRCGSTLVSQMLAALPAHVVFSEPEAFHEVLRADTWPAPLSAPERIGHLRGLVHACGTRRFPEERRLFLKLDPWHVLDLPVIRAAFPGVPWIFLYRDPVEILVSQSDNFAETMAPDSYRLARMGMTWEEVAQGSAEDFCARALALLARTAADEAVRDPLARLVSYPQLPEAVETLVAPWFGLTLDAADREHMQATTHFHAKSSRRLAFTVDSTRKQRDAGEDLRALAERWIAPEYRRLERLRTAGK